MKLSKDTVKLIEDIVKELVTTSGTAIDAFPNVANRYYTLVNYRRDLEDGKCDALQRVNIRKYLNGEVC